MPALLALFVLLLIAGAVVGPFFTIWTLNLLFGLTLQVTLKTWLAAFWLNAIVYGSAYRATK